MAANAVCTSCHLGDGQAARREPACRAPGSRDGANNHNIAGHDENGEAAEKLHNDDGDIDRYEQRFVCNGIEMGVRVHENFLASQPSSASGQAPDEEADQNFSIQRPAVIMATIIGTKRTSRTIVMMLGRFLNFARPVHLAPAPRCATKGRRDQCARIEQSRPAGRPRREALSAGSTLALTLPSWHSH